MHVIAVASQKGGVGKTTIALNLALALAQAGRRTLILELDAQGSVGPSLGLADRAHAGLAELLTGAEALPDVLQRARDPELRVLLVGRVDPAMVAGFEEALTRGPVLPQLLAKLSADFELVVLDCPAGLGKVTTCALEAATHVLSPLQAEPLALRSLGQMLSLVDRLRAERNPKLSLLGVVLSMFDRQAPASLEVAETLWTKFPGGILLDTVIPRDETFLTASLQGAPLLLMRERPPPLSRVFDQLAHEVLDRLDPRAGAALDRAQRLLTLLEARSPEPHVARLRVALRAGIAAAALDPPTMLGSGAIPRIEIAVGEILGLDRAALQRLL